MDGGGTRHSAVADRATTQPAMTMRISATTHTVEAEPADTPVLPWRSSFFDTGSGKKKSNGDSRDPGSADCDSRVLDAMKKTWGMSANGTSGVEATFVLVGTPDKFTVVQVSFTNQQMAQSFQLPTGAFAIYHVHPTKGDPRPSAGDQALANSKDLAVSTISSQGLFEYNPTNTDHYSTSARP
jgi:hypothetical protein